MNNIFDSITKQIDIIEQSIRAYILISNSYDILAKASLAKPPHLNGDILINYHFNKEMKL